MLRITCKALLAIIVLFVLASVAAGQGADFTYQGKLTDGGTSADGPHDFIFRLFDGAGPGATQIGGDLTLDDVLVTAGIFTVSLDFGAGAFSGGPRFLEISVRGGSSTGTYAQLLPRQPVSSAPYAIKSLNAANAEIAINALELGGVSASQYVITSDPRMADARPPTPGSDNYIQNGSTPQEAANFNIGGNGTIGGVLAAASGSATAPSLTFSGDTDTGFFRSASDTLHFSTSGVSRMTLDSIGRVGIGTGIGAGFARLTVTENDNSGTTAYGIASTASGSTGFRAGVLGQSFFNGPQAADTSGFGIYGLASGAAFNFGSYGFAFGSGTVNIGVFGTATGGTFNWAGYFNGNTYVFGNGIVRSQVNSDSNAGISLTLNDQPGWSVATANTGHFQVYNDAIGQNALWIDKTTNNTGIGTFTPNAKLDVAGIVNTSTQYNIGGVRVLDVSGAQNLFAGRNAGRVNVGGSNTFVGHVAGANNTDGYSNSFFGQQAGDANVSGFENAFFGAGAGASNLNSFNSFFGTFAGSENTIGSGNAFFGRVSGGDNTEGSANAFFGAASGQLNTNGHYNVFIGSNAGQVNTTGHFNTSIGSIAGPSSNNLSYSTAIGARSSVGTSDTIVVGKTAGNYDGTFRPADTVVIPGTLTVSGPISGTVSNATNAVNATTANNVTGIVAIANGGTGSSTKTFVDLSTNQTIGGNKTFTGDISGNGSGLTDLNGSNITSGLISEGRLALPGMVFSGRVNGLTSSTSSSHIMFGAASAFSNNTLFERLVTTRTPNRPCTAINLSAELLSNGDPTTPGVNNARTLYLMVNGSSTILCSFFANSTTCNSNFTAAVPAGARISLLIYTVDGGATGDVGGDSVIFGWECR